MLTYFVLFLVGVGILQEIFKEISRTPYSAELSRLGGIAFSTLDASSNIERVCITVITLFTTFLLVLPVAWVHMITRDDESYASLTQTLIMLSLIVAGVMLLLQDNLARSFGLVGVVAAVRYRNTLDDPKDAVFVFLSLGIGMACGLQSFHVGLILSAFECAILLVLWIYHTGTPRTDERDLLKTLKANQKKGARTAAEALAWLEPEARRRVEADLATQSRYITMADTFRRKGKKRPNAVITVIAAKGSSSASKHLNAELEEHRGKWRLLGSEDKDGVTVLEYMGRLPRRHTPPLRFLERLRNADPDIRHVTFRSLREMLAERAEISGTADEVPKDHSRGFHSRPS
jgi:hypothetical protein